METQIEKSCFKSYNSLVAELEKESKHLNLSAVSIHQTPTILELNDISTQWWKFGKMSHVSVSWDLDTRRDDKKQKETTPPPKKNPNTNDEKGK